MNLCPLIKVHEKERNIVRNILLTKITAVQTEAALSYHRVRGLYFPAIIFAATIVS